jgi:hypothetical protein
VSRAGSALFVALLVASAVVAAAVLHARSPDLVLEVTRITKEIDPTGKGPDRVAHIHFFVRESDPDARVEIVGPNLKLIRVLSTEPLVADKPVAFTWNGRTRGGALADPRDRYRLRVLLPNRDRDMVYPRRISVRPVAPQ